MHNDFYCQEILSGNTKIDKIIETENVLVFHHTRPAFPIHVVIIPKTHTLDVTTFLDEQKDILQEMMEVISQVMKKMKDQHGGCRLTTNIGSCQMTKHLHWHVYAGEEMM